ARLRQSPAQIDIIASDAEDWIEPTDHVQLVFSEHHVASRNVLGNPSRKQNHTGVPRCVCHRVGFPPIIRWRKVRSPNTDIFPFKDGTREKFQPVNVRVRIIVDERDHFSSGCLYASITRLTETHILCAY